MERWISDFRQAGRSLFRNPAYFVGAALALALGIGATTLVFGVIHSVLLSPLPYSEPDRLTVVLEADPDTRRGRQPTSPANFADWKARNRSFALLAAAHPASPVLRGDGPPRQIPALRVSQSLFRLLGVSPALGRDFAETEEDRLTAVASHDLWLSEFGGDPTALGRTILLDGQAFTLIGVMPAGFEFPPFWATGAKLWVPLDASLENGASRRSRMLRVFGRLREGVALTQAQQDMDRIAADLAAEYPRDNPRLTIQVEPLREPVVSDFRSAAWLGLAIAACILLIACANTANMTLARASNQRREMAIRTALGADRRALARRWLAESLWIALAGAGFGVPLSLLAITLIRQSKALSVPRIGELSFSLPVAVFALAVSLLAGLLSGIIPAWRHSRSDLGRVVGARVALSPGDRRTRSFLAVAEVSLAIVLLSAAGLLAKSFARMLESQPGFSTDRLVTVDFSLAATDRTSAERQLQLFEELSAEVLKLPGVEGAGFINHLHLGGDLWQIPYQIEGEPPADPGLGPAASHRVIWPGLLEVMDIALLRGREFTGADRSDSPPVVIVNHTLAARHWPDANPLGRRLRLGSPDSDAPWATVVGVAADVPQQSLAREPLAEVYVPYAQNPFPWWLRSTLAIRARDGGALHSSLAETLRRIEQDLAVSPPRNGRDLIGETSGDWRRNAFLAGLFSSLATLLAAAGLYGLIHFQVVQERRDTAIRMAMGASRRDILGRVMGRGFRLALSGSVLGLAAALLLGRFLGGFLYHVTPEDPMVLAGVALLMIAVAAIASLFPAIRASRSDPMEVLRHEAG